MDLPDKYFVIALYKCVFKLQGLALLSFNNKSLRNCVVVASSILHTKKTHKFKYFTLN